MQLTDQVIIITGAASGIGRAMATRFAQCRPKAIICADRDIKGAEHVARQIGADIGADIGAAYEMDATKEADIAALTEQVISRYGGIDLFCSNAGMFITGGAEVDNRDWDKIWHLHVMAHIWAARYALPSMLARKSGYFLNTISAAGLLSQVGSAPYAVSKHAAIGFAEWLAMTYGAQGIKVSALCPQAVATPLLGDVENSVAGLDGIKTPEEVADCALQGIEEERFLILPHPQVYDYMQVKARDYERWLGGMRKLNEAYDY